MGKPSNKANMVSNHNHNHNLNTNNTIVKKKKGRPSRHDLQQRALLLQQQYSNSNPNSSGSPPKPNPNPNPNPNPLHRPSRSIRPALSPDFVHPSDYAIDDEDYNYIHTNHQDEDDERVEKKIKLVRRLPHSSSPQLPLLHQDESLQDEKGTKATDTQLEETKMVAPGPTTTITAAATASNSTTTPLPHKKLLLLILDKLQKKDTRGVFAEPVDPEELPDYHEIIENPMDFGTVKQKLDGGLYSTLEQLEADINLICSNAMEYNAQSTIFFRQARSIEELAKKEFEILRQDGGQNEPPPRPRRGRPPGSRNMKRLLENSSVDHDVPESKSDATPASLNDDVRSNSYNLRKGPSLYRFPRNPDTCFDFSASSSKSSSVMKYGKKHESDENKRETYDLPGQDSSLSTTFETFDKKLIPVGLGYNHSYARSLALFAADLGPVVWKIASNKIEKALPPGVEFGPGWIGETKTLSGLPENAVPILQDSFTSKPDYPSISGFPSSSLGRGPPSSRGNENFIEPKGLGPSSSEWSSIKAMDGLVGTPVGFGGGFGFGLDAREGMVGSTSASASFEHSQLLKSHPLQTSQFEVPSHTSLSRMQEAIMNTREHDSDIGGQGMPYWQTLSMQEGWGNSNVASRFQVSTTTSRSNSRLSIGSPPQLDLVLQL